MILPKRRLRAILGLLAASLATALVAAWPGSRLPAARAHDPPKPCSCGGSPPAFQARPLNDMPIGCLAEMLGGGIFSIILTATDATANWQYQFTCPPAAVNLCSTCRQVLFEYWSNPIPGEPAFWALAPGGSPGPVKVDGDCDWTFTVTVSSTYTYPPPPWSATQYRVSVWAGPWKPAEGADCVGQLVGPPLDWTTFTTLGN